MHGSIPNPAEVDRRGNPLTRFDVRTMQGRSYERYRRALLTAASSGASRGVSLLTMLISVPRTVRYRGTERVALWATITSSLALLVFADFGIGNGLVNAISQSDGAEDREAAISYVSTSFFLLLGIAVITALAF
jgi:O-antigen/teichoic acid export membrane protein